MMKIKKTFQCDILHVRLNSSVSIPSDSVKVSAETSLKCCAEVFEMYPARQPAQ